jgi:hypothetical protein
MKWKDLEWRTGLAEKRPPKTSSIDFAQLNAGIHFALHSPALKSGARLSRSEVVTIRLDPKLRYLAELAARKQRRTLSSFVEWAIEQSLSEVEFTENSSVADNAMALWDVDECDRFVKLALRDESLLNYDEQVLWKRLQEEAGIRSKDEEKLDWKNLRKLWAQLARSPTNEPPEKPASRKT